jgi:hypothetical protein
MSVETIGVPVRVFALRAMGGRLDELADELATLAGVAGGFKTWDAEQVRVELSEACAAIGAARGAIEEELLKLEGRKT